MGFFNPIPSFRNDHSHPVLCLVYKKPSIDNDAIHIDYYKDSEEVKI